MEEFLIKVAKIAEHKYQLEEDTLEAFADQIEWCFNNGFTPIRTVEHIANQIF